jgi:hypothetical protein
VIPGCSGSGGGNNWDYCYDPNWSYQVATPDGLTEVTPAELISPTAFNERFVSGGGIIKRQCNTCGPNHVTIVYKRISAMPAGEDWDKLFRDTWVSKDNTLNTDFELYNSVADAKAGTNKWKFCNYNDNGIGFPRDCGPEHSVGHQWNSKTRGGKQVTWFMPTRVFHAPGVAIAMDQCDGKLTATRTGGPSKGALPFTPFSPPPYATHTPTHFPLLSPRVLLPLRARLCRCCRLSGGGVRGDVGH